MVLKRLTVWGRIVGVEVLVMGMARGVWGLTPEEVGVIYNTRSEASQKIARHYQEARKIPEENLIPLTVEPEESIDEATYRKTVVPQILRSLADRKLEGSIKCLVTTYDVPLKIGPQKPTEDEQKEVGAYRNEYRSLVAELEGAVGKYDAIGPQGESPATSLPAKKPGEQRKLNDILAEVIHAAQGAAKRVEAMTGPERALAMGDLVKEQDAIWGLSGVLRTIHVRADADESDKGRQQLEDYRSELQALEDEAGKLEEKIGEAPARQKLTTLRRKSDGVVGQIQQVEMIIALLSMEESDACFDSELMLLENDQNYPRAKWAYNPLQVEQYPTMSKGHPPKVLMVTRLDGPTVEGVIEMIDTTIKVEQKGLDGKMYVDARGLKGSDGYGIFDSHLRQAAEYLKDNSTMPVILDNQEGLLKAEDCPDAALYVGWYALKHYQDSCQWVPGAVGYHIASYEMTTLHGAHFTGWVPGLLKHGFCGTLGPVAEPYVNAFPKPNLFFPLLLSGEFTQGEVWLVTAPMLSWRVGYIGDPLYNPFKVKPRMTVEKLKAHPALRNAFVILRGEKVGE